MAIEISTLAEFQAINNALAGEYTLVVSSINNAGAPFTQIGTVATPFTGIIHGNGASILNLSVSRTGAGNYVSVIHASTGTITDLHLDAVVTGEDRVSIFGGGGTIRRCRATGSVSTTHGGAAYAGGFTQVSGSTSIVENCECHVEVNAPNATQYVGGFCAYLASGSACSNSYSTGAVNTPAPTNVGGFAGRVYQTTVSGNIYDSTTSGRTDSIGATPKTTAQMKQQATFAGWDFENVWQIDEGNDYPRLRVFMAELSGVVGGRVSLSAAGVMAALGRKDGAGSLAVSGAGLLAPVGRKAGSGACRLTGAGVAALLGRKQARGLVLLSSSGVIAVTGRLPVAVGEWVAELVLECPVQTELVLECPVQAELVLDCR